MKRLNDFEMRALSREIERIVSVCQIGDALKLLTCTLAAYIDTYGKDAGDRSAMMDACVGQLIEFKKLMNAKNN